MHKKTYLILSLICVLVVTACGTQSTPPVVPTVAPTTVEQENEFRTLVAGTLTAVATLTTPTLEIIPTETPIAEPTFEPMPTIAPTREIVTITLTENVNCRKGPGTYWGVLTGLRTGTVVEAFGIDPTGLFYYVQNPDKPGSSCWMWGGSSTVSGRLQILPIFTPQPTPWPTRTPTPVPQPFIVTFIGLTQCGSGVAANFKITNTGTVKLESIRIDNSVAGDDTLFTHISDKFTYWSNGSVFQSSKELLVKEEAIVSTCQPGGFPYDPSGKKIKTEVRVCSANGMAGICYRQEFFFIP